MFEGPKGKTWVIKGTDHAEDVELRLHENGKLSLKQGTDLIEIKDGMLKEWWTTVGKAYEANKVKVADAIQGPAVNVKPNLQPWVFKRGGYGAIPALQERLREFYLVRCRNGKFPKEVIMCSQELYEEVEKEYYARYASVPLNANTRKARDMGYMGFGYEDVVLVWHPKFHGDRLMSFNLDELQEAYDMIDKTEFMDVNFLSKPRDPQQILKPNKN